MSRPPPDSDVPTLRGPGRPRDARADAAIATAVAELLAEVGYGALTIEGVAARAGVAKTTIYRRFAEGELAAGPPQGRDVAVGRGTAHERSRDRAEYRSTPNRCRMASSSSR